MMTATPTMNLVNPATEETFRTLEMTSEAELGAILERMRAAQKKWREVPVNERVEICRGFVDAFRSMRETVALDITRQMGKPLVQAQARSGHNAGSRGYHAAPRALGPRGRDTRA